MKKMLLVLAMLMSLTFASLSVESFEVSPSLVKPGEDANIKITLKNVQPTGSTTATSAKNVALYHPSVQGILFKTESPTVVGTIEVGASAIASIPIRVSQDATGGIIAPTFVIRQDGQNDQILTVPVKVTNPPILVFSLDKQTIQGTDTLNITITNNGGAIKKLTIKINNTDKFSLVGSDQIFVPNVTNTANFLMPIDSRNANEGINSMILTLNYEGEGGELATESKSISVNVKKEKTDIIFTQDSKLITSKDNLLQLKVKNTGRFLEDFRIVINDESIKPKESNEIKLGNLNT
ncbi:hypothetical protein HY570_00775, partial [Candidatus Micrarchaeota archaeon]|nr:hypothetical protein [Candidatus Micrarchaeota archaeon]